MMMEENYYEVLEVSEDASSREISKAYRQKALECHPDKNPDDAVDAQRRFHLITKAYAVLNDAEARAALDRVLKMQRHHQQRLKAMDAERLAFRDDLLAREAASKEMRRKEMEAARAMQQEMDRVKRSMSDRLHHCPTLEQVEALEDHTLSRLSSIIAM